MYGHQGGKVMGEGGGGMNWEIGIDIYTLICIKQITNKNQLYKKLINYLKKEAAKDGQSQGEPGFSNQKFHYYETPALLIDII